MPRKLFPLFAIFLIQAGSAPAHPLIDSIAGNYVELSTVDRYIISKDLTIRRLRGAGSGIADDFTYEIDKVELVTDPLFPESKYYVLIGHVKKIDVLNNFKLKVGDPAQCVMGEPLNRLLNLHCEHIVETPVWLGFWNPIYPHLLPILDRSAVKESRLLFQDEQLPLDLPVGSTELLYTLSFESPSSYPESYVADLGVELRGPHLEKAGVGCRIRHPDGTWLAVPLKKLGTDWLGAGFGYQDPIPDALAFSHKPIPVKKHWILELKNLGTENIRIENADVNILRAYGKTIR